MSSSKAPSTCMGASLPVWISVYASYRAKEPRGAWQLPQRVLRKFPGLIFPSLTRRSRMSLIRYNLISQLLTRSWDLDASNLLNRRGDVPKEG
jgi:hypothetical protein